ncbi:MAG: hypothetical protein CBC48_06655 [bacterium TMED88]|nr:hypothetical protein [Deltaproteobacteria bacterium]OUV33938.1 MAG: hypothetical protein CBC48_06655 [bacterium TMED88]
MIRGIALVLTLLTGFSGLVYEVAWQRYLGTLLGSHSEATSAVLAIFLGGLSVGYWAFGVLTRRLVAAAEGSGRPPKLLLAYGILEASIGVYVILFPWLFQGVQTLSYQIPHGPAGVGFAVDVVLAALLIGPASVLMGGTIPMLTQALARSLEDATRFHAFVYAFNTAGAFAGALAAGFYLVPKLGLVNVMLTMGLINLAAGAIFILMGRQGESGVAIPSAGPREGAPLEGFGLYASVALLVGFVMMAMQTIVIRVAGLAFGSSQFTFSMVVAVFVLCIALGSFLVSSISRIPQWVIVANQWGLLALLVILYFQIDAVPYWIYSLRTLVTNQDPAFGLYYGLGFLAVLAFIGPAVVLSGASLPLLFHQMQRQLGHLGDVAGNLYSWNTIGSLFGALLGGYVLLFWMDLEHIFIVSLVALVLAAAMLTVRVYSLKPWAAIALVLPALALVALPNWDPRLLYAGLFRIQSVWASAYDGPEGFLEAHQERFGIPVRFQMDDPISSITVTEIPVPGGGTSLTIATNGKSDGNTHLDYATMALAATLPALMAEKAESAFVIGWGTGITAGELASLDTMQRVDVVEISPGVLEAAPLFDFANLDASSDPKVHMIRSDAFRALMRLDRQYDVIASEPSNPWVTGVEMLYSREFLEAAKGRLTPGGVYCQWLHQYETDSQSIEMILRTYRSVFERVAIWGTIRNDLVLLGWNDGAPPVDLFRLEDRSQRPDFKASLERAGIDRFSELLAHEIFPQGVIHALDLEGPLHTLYHPRLNDIAGRAFFRRDRGELPFIGYGAPARVASERSLYQNWARLQGPGLTDADRAGFINETCRVFGSRCLTPFAQWLAQQGEGEATPELLDLAAMPYLQNFLDKDGESGASPVEMSKLFDDGRPFGLDGQRVTPPFAEMLTQDFEALYLAATPFSADRLLDLWSQCREGQRSVATCVAEARRESSFSTEAAQKASIEECLSIQIFGEACQAGLEQAQALLHPSSALSDQGL